MAFGHVILRWAGLSDLHKIMAVELTGNYSPFEDTSADETPVIEAQDSTLEDERLIHDETRPKRFRPRARALVRRRRKQPVSVVSDAFIESSKNMPHYVKEDVPDDLLV